MTNEKQIVKVDRQNTRAKFDLNTFNETDRTVEITFATETPVRSYDWEIGRFIEVLSCDPNHVDLTRMKSGAPVLDNHDRYSKTAKAVVGVVEDAWIADGVCRAKVRFSDSEDDSVLMNKVKDGIVTGVSCGYDVFAYELTRAVEDNALPTYKAVNWQPTEVSFVAVQADINSRVRSEGDTSTEATVQDVTPAPAAEEAPQPEDDTNTDHTEQNNNNINNNEMENVNVPTPEALDQTRSAATTAERTRISGIRSLVRALNGVDPSFADTLIDEGVDLPTAQTRALAEWESKNPLNSNPQAAVQTQNDGEKTRSAMANALVLRINPQAASVMGEENVRAAADFRAMPLVRLAEESLIRSGVRTVGMSQREIAQAALGKKIRGLHHTTDFPLLLGDTVQRTLLAAYAIQARTFMPFTRKVNLPDFRSVTRVRITDLMGNLEIVREGGEYKRGTMGEGGESYSLNKYGKIIGITWEAIVNDDLSAFNRVPQAFAAKAAMLQSDVVYGILTGNPVMSDGVTLFHANHGNTATAAALSEASLTAAYKLFRDQKTEGGDYINVTPKYLIVGSELEFTAIKLTSTAFTPAKQSDVAVAALTGLTPIVDPRVTGKKWFLSASPDAVDTIEYAFLDGEEELFIEQREGFDIDGIEIKARVVFGAKAIDWRGMYYNAGA